MQILEVNGLRKVYTTRFGGASVEALRNINFSVENGEYVAIMGESGSGKTTLLNILAALDRPTDGKMLVLHAPGVLVYVLLALLTALVISFLMTP